MLFRIFPSFEGWTACAEEIQYEEHHTKTTNLEAVKLRHIWPNFKFIATSSLPAANQLYVTTIHNHHLTRAFLLLAQHYASQSAPG